MKLNTILLWAILLIAIYLMYTFNLLEGQASCNPKATPPQFCPDGSACPDCGRDSCPCSPPCSIDDFCDQLNRLYESGKCNFSDNCNDCVGYNQDVFRDKLGCTPKDVDENCKEVSHCNLLVPECGDVCIRHDDCMKSKTGCTHCNARVPVWKKSYCIKPPCGGTCASDADCNYNSEQGCTKCIRNQCLKKPMS